MPLIYAGIDEAGYGPMLGPLAVAAAVWVVDRPPVDGSPPDLWHDLRRAVGRAASDAPRLLPIADSKRLKLPATSPRRHPLVHLEAGVLAVLATLGDCPADDDAALSAVHAEWPAHPWYAGPPTPLPVGNDAAALRLHAAALRSACEHAGVRPAAVRCRLVGEAAFNEGLERRGSKALVAADAVATLIRGILAKWGGEHPIRIAVDRQSGRADYHDLLASAVPGGRVVQTHREPGVTRYTLHPAGAPRVDAAVRFEVAAEDRHLPVALASMTAKLSRELAMIRFNRHWGARVPDLKPTAGYVTDARRWLRDARHAVTGDERRELVRRA